LYAQSYLIFYIELRQPSIVRIRRYNVHYKPLSGIIDLALDAKMYMKSVKGSGIVRYKKSLNWLCKLNINFCEKRVQFNVISPSFYSDTYPGTNPDIQFSKTLHLF